MAILGILVLAGARLLYLRSSSSIETALERAHPGRAISYNDPALTSIPQGQLVWYATDGQPHVAWATRQIFGWQVKAWREIPSTHAPSEVAWTAWNPNDAWGLFIAQAPQNITEVRVNGNTANNVPETGIWWLSVDGSLSPPIDIAAYDVHHNVSWRYPSTGQ